MTIKVRLDRLLMDRGLAHNLEKAGALILSGAVLMDECRVDKAGLLVDPKANIRVKGRDEAHPYVSRGGLKLKGALDDFGINVQGFIAVDVGASTGGFTDCLLQEGTAKVYALDVGYGLLSWRLRQDSRVVVIERTNIRFFDHRGIINEPIDLAAIDVSFISLKLVIPAVKRILKGEAAILALVKPQFEVERGRVGKNGVVKDPEEHQKVLQELIRFCGDQGFAVLGHCESPIKGPAGNREFFIHARLIKDGGVIDER
jgi:23S rRNA (cytidine1920-2'-O)/16S rRNA (cytidine1409-2'-O)-methyltransferase